MWILNQLLYSWNSWQKSNLTISLNVFSAKNNQIYPGYISELKSKGEKQVILLIISHREGCH